jgi:hypothetical protein
METPHIPLALSLLTVVWWVGVWGLSETVMTLMFKESILMKLGTYLLMIASVFLVILFNPQLAKQL